MVKIIGVSFPIPSEYTPRFFNDGKNVFIKRATTFKELKPGMKLVIYQSQKRTGFIGEAIIKKILLSEDPYSFFDIFGDAIFLTKEELTNYVQSQKKWSYPGKNPRKRICGKKRQWVALELEDISKYDKTIIPDRYIPVCGKYIYEE